MVTQQKLIVEEEEEIDEVELITEPTPTPQPAEEAAEIRLLRCLLYGHPLDWIRSEGLLLSVLVDSANERFYDEFADNPECAKKLDEMRELLFAGKISECSG